MTDGPLVPDGAGSRGRRSRARVAVMLLVGTAVALATGLGGGWVYAPLAGWDVAALVFAVSVWAGTVRLDADGTRSHATQEDPSRATSDLIVMVAAVASLVAVGAVLIEASSAKGARQGLLAGFGLASVAVSWFAVHTLFTLRYASLFYEGTVGGIDFNQDEPPRYTDFAYLAFTLGMTYQVSDTDLKTHAIRATALRHGLLSYLFGSVILATAINLVVGLAGSSGG